MIYILMINDISYINYINSKHKNKLEIEVLNIYDSEEMSFNNRIFHNIEDLIDYWFNNSKNDDFTYMNIEIVDILLKKCKNNDISYISKLSSGKIKHYIINEKSNYRYVYYQKKNCIKKLCEFLKNKNIKKHDIFMACHKINEEIIKESNILNLLCGDEFNALNIEPLEFENLFKIIYEKKHSTNIVFPSCESSIILTSIAKSFCNYKLENIYLIDKKTISIYDEKGNNGGEEK